MTGEHLEVLPNGESYELRVDGKRVALIDRMLFEAMMHWAKEGRITPWLECVAIPGDAVQRVAEEFAERIVKGERPSGKPLTERLK